MLKHARHKPIYAVLMCLPGALVLLAACSPVEPTATSAPRPSVTPGATQAATVVTGTTEVTVAVAALGNQPVSLRIAELGMEVPVAPMGWEPALVGEKTTTVWVVPERTAGWMPNTAGAGEPGNVVIAGHQAQGDAVFAPLALGEILPGQTIEVTSEDGRSFDYKVMEVSDPIPVLGATEADDARAADYVAPSTTARLTLVSGWPGDTTTHRIFVVAELVGPAQ